MGLATRLGTDRQSFTEGELRIREQDFNVYEDGKENRKQEIYIVSMRTWVKGMPQSAQPEDSEGGRGNSFQSFGYTDAECAMILHEWLN